MYVHKLEDHSITNAFSMSSKPYAVLLCRLQSGLERAPLLSLMSNRGLSGRHRVRCVVASLHAAMQHRRDHAGHVRCCTQGRISMRCPHAEAADAGPPPSLSL